MFGNKCCLKREFNLKVKFSNTATKNTSSGMVIALALTGQSISEIDNLMMLKIWEWFDEFLAIYQKLGANVELLRQDLAKVIQCPDIKILLQAFLKQLQSTIRYLIENISFKNRFQEHLADFEAIRMTIFFWAQAYETGHLTYDNFEPIILSFIKILNDDGFKNNAGLTDIFNSITKLRSIADGIDKIDKLIQIANSICQIRDQIRSNQLAEQLFHFEKFIRYSIVFLNDQECLSSCSETII